MNEGVDALHQICVVTLRKALQAHSADLLVRRKCDDGVHHRFHAPEPAAPAALVIVHTEQSPKELGIVRDLLCSGDCGHAALLLRFHPQLAPRIPELRHGLRTIRHLCADPHQRLQSTAPCVLGPEVAPDHVDQGLEATLRLNELSCERQLLHQLFRFGNVCRPHLFLSIQDAGGRVDAGAGHFLIFAVPLERLNENAPSRTGCIDHGEILGAGPQGLFFLEPK
mmetsp:Transcript_98003/g.219302  ORF Transcript_98003/g.219302 Transcript_98003/m.219302 type:complete len:224 (-) Transcript_98003:1584-2255(-)